MKMKKNGNRDISCCGVSGLYTGVQEDEKGREGGAVLLNDV